MLSSTETQSGRGDEPINVSALNQYAYCPRRCGLIYLEAEFEENVHTARGHAEHQRVDRAAHETTKSCARIEYALPIWSGRLGLVGRCDVVEFHKDGTIFPVEYKRGPRRARLNDDLQLAAQAMCLEEMMGRVIDRGAIFHASSKRRREVQVDEQLRGQVEATVGAIREMLASGRLPPPVNDSRCRECSLNQVCQPSMVASQERLQDLRRELFDLPPEPT